MIYVLLYLLLVFGPSLFSLALLIDCVSKWTGFFRSQSLVLHLLLGGCASTLLRLSIYCRLVVCSGRGLVGVRISCCWYWLYWLRLQACEALSILRQKFTSMLNSLASRMIADRFLFFYWIFDALVVLSFLFIFRKTVTGQIGMLLSNFSVQLLKRFFHRCW